MAPSSPHTPHALASELAAIRAIAERPVHPRTAEGQAAMAIYEDVCWRLALAHFSPNVLATVTRLEGEAAALLRRYMGGTLEAGAFWAGFEAIVEQLDARTADESLQAQDERDAGRLLRDVRTQVAHAGLAPTLRAGVQRMLELMDDALAAYHAGKIETSDFGPLFNQAEGAVREVLMGAGGFMPDSPEARLARTARAALAARPPAFMRSAIAERLLLLAAACEAASPVPLGVLGELESLVERAEQFIAAHGEAVQRREALSQAVTRQALKPPYALQAFEQLEVMAAMLSTLESGGLEPDVFSARFEASAHQLAQLLLLGGTTRGDTDEAEVLLDEARVRVAEAHLPRFVSHTARELLTYAGGLVEDLRAEPGESTAFWPAFRDALVDVEACLGFGREIASEETYALRRFEQLQRRLDGLDLHPLLRGPVADLQETLRNLLNRLEAGLYHLAEFHHTYEEVAGRLDALLAWQAALAGEGVGPGGPAAPPSARG